MAKEANKKRKVKRISLAERRNKLIEEVQKIANKCLWPSTTVEEMNSAIDKAFAYKDTRDCVKLSKYCANGHLYTTGTYKMSKDGKRLCMECRTNNANKLREAWKVYKILNS